ncbi:(2Fe-2S)-binding protein [Salipiger abyssi]|uniref:Isoquinoline 1-oxidoreductase, alpha subunit n=1 Tax=Salipiger abyssi TaxID=1250539 RepID=A0A1P8US83_9RHOB|nr:(2Fe-2S)-binding protein [Salipiger abyssi]APZ52261.1 isoquinoline 1-oxidoreductase, alpha subunit [Salipiger abyssi]
MVALMVNGTPVELTGLDDKPLLWVLREDLDLLGPKYGCGIAQCGACRVLIDGVSTPSCVTFLGDLEGASVVTVEGLTGPEDALSIVQRAWLEEQVPQCGFCQPGFIIAVTALLATTPRPTDAEIDETITNICRCGTYPRIRRAIHRAADMMAEG